MGQSKQGRQCTTGLSGVNTIYSTYYAFAALKDDGTVEAWGYYMGNDGGSGVPSDLSGVNTIYSTSSAFAALKEDGTVVAWGDPDRGGSGVPTSASHVKTIYSNYYAFAALKEDGTVVAWGDPDRGGSGVPPGLSDVKVISSTQSAFAALTEDGAVAVWGSGNSGGGSLPSDVEGISEIFGTTEFAAISIYPHTLRLSDDLRPRPTSQPTSQPTMPTSQPTTHPTSQPTLQPTTQPTSYPTSSPTLALSEYLRIEQGLTLNRTSLLSGVGLKFDSRKLLSNLGHQDGQHYYISLYVYDTGFGPASEEQYVKFSINGRVIGIQEGNMTFDGCAPLKKAEEEKCMEGYKSCRYNVEVTTSSQRGGSILLEAETTGVMTSPCPYQNHVVNVMYVLSKGVQHTPSPTQQPTYQPTKQATNIVNGLQLDINEMNVWQLFQISIGIGVALAAGGVYLCKLREKSSKVHQHPCRMQWHPWACWVWN